MSEPIEQLKELPVPEQAQIPPFKSKYITVGYWMGSARFWSFEHFETLEQAHSECQEPVYAPGTFRIFEIPEASS
jgi:hypothetical protein